MTGYLQDVHGGVEQGYGVVADVFAQILDTAGEGAVAVSVLYRGRMVVDVWGGRERASGREMASDSLMLVASCSKGITATVLAILIDRGRIDPDALVSSYWPEYGTNGKESTTVAMVASHRAGQPFPPLGAGLRGPDYHRGPALLAALAAAEPVWTPGTAMGYHAVTYGALLGEIIRRATGSTVGEHVGALIREPLGLDMWIGLPEQYAARLIPGRWEFDPFASTTDSDPELGSYAEIRRRSLAEATPTHPDWDDPESVATVAGQELPAVNAATNARALARMYGATIGEVDGVRLYSEETRRRVTTPITDEVPALAESGTTGPDIRFGLGYQLSSPSMPAFSASSFGHTGAGGRLGVADPYLDLSFGFVCSRMGIIGPHGDDRWSTLTAAVRSAVL